MTKIEALTEYITTKVHPDVAIGFLEKYKNNDDHLKFEHLKYEFYVYNESEHNEALLEFIEEEVYELNFALEKTSFKHICKYVNWEDMIKDELNKVHSLSDFDFMMDFGEKINNYYIYIYD